MYKFLLYEPIHEAGLSILRGAGEVRMASSTDEETIIPEIGDINGVVIRSQGAMTRRIMDNAPNLRVVGRHGVGVDNVDLEAATEHGIQVVNTPQATVESVAEHTLGLMLSVSKRIAYADRKLRQGHFEVRYEQRGRELCGRTLGIIGFGRIGRRVAQVCHHGFNMSILYYDLVPAPELEREVGARKVDMEELLQTAAYVSVHVPLLPSTEKLIGAREFDLMTEDTMFFNCSRGPVVDETALYNALAEGKIRGAGIDVFEEEPTPADNPLFTLDNVVVTPHMASATQEAMRSMSLVAEDVVGVLEGNPPMYPVNEV
ncbi:MAG: hydroxyacid dehydrogenase [Chloroflexota bacterium]|nr:hydroxyacid dehydrogenase [Chloroflexota bacterium]